MEKLGAPLSDIDDDVIKLLAELLAAYHIRRSDDIEDVD
jgi:hypothetical protein